MARYKGQIYDYVGMFRSYKVYARENDVLFTTQDNHIIKQLLTKKTLEYLGRLNGDAKHE